MADLQQQIDDLKNQVQDLKNFRNPENMQARIDGLYVKIEELVQENRDLKIKINSYICDDKHIELFTDDEFKDLYSACGLVAKDVAALIKKNEKFKDIDVSAPAISKIINGQIGSITLRSYLGKIFREEIAKIQNI